MRDARDAFYFTLTEILPYREYILFASLLMPLTKANAPSLMAWQVNTENKRNIQTPEPKATQVFLSGIGRCR
jgi:hypothetical protein